MLAVFAYRAQRPGHYRPDDTIAAAPVLENYCRQNRATDLYVFDAGDNFYSAVLPLHRVRYGFVEPDGLSRRDHSHLTYLGILLSAKEFAGIEALTPTYRSRLLSWGYRGDDVIASAITSPDAAGLRALIVLHPEADFLVSRQILPEATADPAHRVQYAGDGLVLLESRRATPSKPGPPLWPCEM